MATPIPNYRKRSGVTKLLQTVKILCRLEGTWHTSILAWVTATIHGPEQDVIVSWLSNIRNICDILERAPDD